MTENEMLHFQQAFFYDGVYKIFDAKLKSDLYINRLSNRGRDILTNETDI